MATNAMMMQVLRFQRVADAQVPMPRLVDALPGIPGFRQALFVQHTEQDQAAGVLVWDGELEFREGFDMLRQKLGAAPPHAEIQLYRVIEFEPAAVPRALFAIATTRQFPSPAHHAAWQQNVRDRIIPALRTLDGFAGVLWGETTDGGAGFALELWSALPAEGATHTAVAQQAVAATLDASLLDTPVLRERFRVLATPSAAVAA